jgi:hypothetical protein
MPLPLLAIGTALGGLGALGKTATGFMQNAQANKINPVWNDTFVNNRLGIAQGMFNGRMAGASDLERNIASAQGANIQNINRNATDASQALALAQGSQTMASDAYNDLQIKEAQNKYAMLENLNNAYSAANQNMLQKFGIETQAKAATREGAFKNIFGGINDAAALGITAGQLQNTGSMGRMAGRVAGQSLKGLF